MAKIGLNATKTFPVYDQTVTIGFWCPTKIVEADSENWTLKLQMRGYTSKASFLTLGKKSYYAPATTTLCFQLTQATWPFVLGQDPWPALWTLIATKTGTDGDGNEINGGVDWSSAKDANFP